MTIRTTRALLCAVGFLCASSGLVEARDKTKVVSKPRDQGIVINLPWNAGDKKTQQQRNAQRPGTRTTAAPRPLIGVPVLRPAEF